MKNARFRFVHLSDTHIQPELGAPQAWQKAIQTINTLQPSPAFVTTGGDLVMDAQAVDRARAILQFRLFREGIDRLRVPVYHTFGNRDAYGWRRDDAADNLPGFGKQMFQRMLGQRETYLSFDYLHWHFVILDSIRYNPPADWVAEIDEKQLEWLSRDLARVGKQRPIVLITHVPLFTIFPQYDAGTTVAPSEKIIVRNAKEVRSLYKDYNVRAVLQGHTHVVEECTYTGTRYITSGAVCGEWWRGPRSGVHPEGFVVLDCDGEDLKWQYVSYGWKAQVS
jgi:3',5'-cyclic AMP phosphodiesterase CpdA